MSLFQNWLEEFSQKTKRKYGCFSEFVEDRCFFAIVDLVLYDMPVLGILRPVLIVLHGGFNSESIISKPVDVNGQTGAFPSTPSNHRS